MLTVKQLHTILGDIIKNKEVSGSAPVMLASDPEGNSFGTVAKDSFGKSFFQLSDGKTTGRKECLVVYPYQDHLQPE